MNICITGALGHIGSALIRSKFLTRFHKVYLIDNFFTQRYASLFNLPFGINYSFHELDILSDKVQPLIKDSDIVIHLAAMTDAVSSYDNLELVKRINKEGLQKIASSCAKNNCLLVFPSTTSVYGSLASNVNEGCHELKPQSPYADSKLWGERLLQSLGQKENLKFVILRLGTIFGWSIGMRFHTVVNKFIWQAVKGEEITIWKTAFQQKRPYCDLKDCLGTVVHIINKNIFDKEVYNIITANLTVAQVINQLKCYFPNLKIKFVNSPAMNNLSYSASRQKSLNRGFSYKGNFEKSVQETVQRLKQLNSSLV